MSRRWIRYHHHPYGVPKEDHRYDVSLARRLWWEICARIREALGK